MKRRASPEHALQVAVAQYLTLALRPPVLWTALDAGAGKMSKAAAGKRKARGVRAGWPDLLVMMPSLAGRTQVIGIELKSKAGSLSLVQRARKIDFQVANAVYLTARSVEEVESILREREIPLHATVSKVAGKGLAPSPSRPGAWSVS